MVWRSRSRSTFVAPRTAHSSENKVQVECIHVPCLLLTARPLYASTVIIVRLNLSKRRLALHPFTATSSDTALHYVLRHWSDAPYRQQYFLANIRSNHTVVIPQTAFEKFLLIPSRVF